MTYTTSNAFNAKITIVVATTAMVGLRLGRTSRLKTCHSVAPSTRAASSSSAGMPFNAAERMTRQKPVHTHTPTAMSARLLVSKFTSQATGRNPGRSAVRAAFRTPICGAPAGRNSYTNFQITLAATKEIAMGRKMIDLAAASYRTRSVSTASSRPAPTVSPVKHTSQRRLLRSAMSISRLVNAKT